MQYAIGKTLLMLLLAAASSGAMAEWVEVGSNDTNTLYVDPAIRWADNTSKMWVLHDFKVDQLDRGPLKSQKVQYEYDCSGQRSRMLYFTAHTENMAGGDIVDFNIVPGEWMPLSENAGQQELWKIACGKA